MIRRFLEWRRQNKIRALARSIWKWRHYDFIGTEDAYRHVKTVMDLAK